MTDDRGANGRGPERDRVNTGRVTGTERVTTHTETEWEEVDRWYRRPLGGWWWLALLLVPLLLALLGLGSGDKDDKKPTAPATTTSTGAATATGDAAAAGSLPEVDMDVKGDKITLTGTVADDTTRTALIDEAEKAFPDATVDGSGLKVEKTAAVLPAGAAAALAQAAGEAGSDVKITLGKAGAVAAGAMPSDEVRTAVADRLREGLPKVTLDTKGLTVKGAAGSQPTGTVGSVAGRDVSCDTLEADLAGVQKNQKITFVTDGSALDARSMRLVNQMGGLVKKCDGVRLTVTGYTDSNGDARMNQALSERRAQSVVNALAQAGVAKGSLAAVGKGESNPIASNATPQGMAKNRRVEITVK